ncbi:hypothetical protein QBC38DRAFT_448790 [Podospora fimiseda]|uniref:Uncharacterized protein n=1 Tax=Podospora fimiseda TaxID=252190 RepID=A0AAN6YQ42_9PEZI|nr:hypothetical protein QBC38DRAFT_448790 [Podospora fimiseda]
MSHSRYRDYYHPWKLCYENQTIRRLAADSQQYHLFRRMSEQDTYCGALLQSIHDSNSWFSRSGGLIEVEGQYYLFTTSHTPSKEEDPSSSSAFSSSPGDTLHEDTFSKNIEPAIVLVSHESQEDANDPPPAAPTFDEEATLIDVHPSPRVVEDFDWKLISIISPKLPNFVHVNGEKQYISDFCDSPRRCVLINAGPERHLVGTLSPSPTVIVEDGHIEEV